jgi:hypothetical protein
MTCKACQQDNLFVFEPLPPCPQKMSRRCCTQQASAWPIATYCAAELTQPLSERSGHCIRCVTPLNSMTRLGFANDIRRRLLVRQLNPDRSGKMCPSAISK